MRSVIILSAMLMAGCASTPKAEIKTVEVKVPVIQACVPKSVPQPPAAYADENLSAEPDPVERLKKVGAANKQRSARLSILEPVIAACR